MFPLQPGRIMKTEKNIKNLTDKKLNRLFFTRDVLDVAPELLGKKLNRKFDNGEIKSFIITEVEAYRGEDDLACHASKGMTPRNKVMYNEGGLIYVYLIYGIHWMFNIVTSVKGNPQAVLIRGIEGFSGPGRVTKALGINKSFYAIDVVSSEKIWFSNSGEIIPYTADKRIGIDYAGNYWANKPWRFIAI